VRVTDPLIGDPGRLMLLAQVAVASAAAALVYIAYTRLLRIPELQQTIDIARSFVRRGGGGSSGSAGSGGDSSSGAGGDV
jgi:hypothetical protein